MRDIFKLLKGFKQFSTDIENVTMPMVQNPKILVIACSDSRVDPAILSKASLGEIFVIRNVANIVPPYEDANHIYHHGTSAAIEYAVQFLNIKYVIILGHSHCGGINFLLNYDKLENKKDFIFIQPWLQVLHKAVEITKNITDKAAKTCACEQESIKISVKNIKSFPFVQKSILENNLSIYGLYFEIEKGKLFYYNEDDNIFVSLEELKSGNSNNI